MNSALSPREIQARLRAGASVPEVAEEAGVDVDRISGFAIPVMAERAHITRTALASSARRRGDSSGHRRLGEIIHDRLQARGLDADVVEWDSWRQNDLRWRVVGLLDDQAASRAAEFLFDPKGRFSIADNADARWMIGEELPGPQSDPDNEITIDFHDEFALVRAVTEDPAHPMSPTAEPMTGAPPVGQPGDDVPLFESPYETSAHTSELDELYDLLSGVSEDSVRVYLGLEDDESEDALAEELSEHPDLPAKDVEDSSEVVEDSGDSSPEAAVADVAPPTPQQEVPASQDTVQGVTDPSQTAPEQDPLVPEEPVGAPKRKPSRKRASIPSWDEIMFGGPLQS